MSVQSHESLAVQAVFSAGTADINLRLYDHCGGSIVDESSTSTGIETIDIINTTSGIVDYLLEVYIAHDSIGECSHYEFFVAGVSEDLGTSYCTSTVNSSGHAAVIDATGDRSVAANDVRLIAEHVPVGQNGIFYYGGGMLELPFGNGFRCVGGDGHGIFRLPVVFADAHGVLAYQLDLAHPPLAAGLISASSTWNFQAWFRDPGAGGAFFNLSDGISIPFLP